MWTPGYEPTTIIFGTFSFLGLDLHNLFILKNNTKKKQNKKQKKTIHVSALVDEMGKWTKCEVDLEEMGINQSCPVV